MVDLKGTACNNILNTGACPYGVNCKYSHDPEIIKREKEFREEQKRLEEEAARERQLAAEREATLPFLAQHLQSAVIAAPDDQNDPFTKASASMTANSTGTEPKSTSAEERQPSGVFTPLVVPKLATAVVLNPLQPTPLPSPSPLSSTSNLSSLLGIQR